MGVTERKLRQQEEMRKQIIECSREIVHEEGWAALSIRKIADAIEYSVPVIYKYFENKEAISAYFVAEGFDLLYAQITAGISTEDSIEERFQQLGLGYYLFAERHPKHYEIMFGLGIPTCETAKNIKSVGLLSDLFRNMIDELIQKSGRKDIDACIKYRSLWAMLHGVVALELLSLTGSDKVCNSLILADSMRSFTKGI